jgi:2-polyprenyl-3-methyl-5-hydroxy-6-metoxy-1,4-benzoquinol methylase
LLTASVTADPSVAYEPTGTVTFYDGCTVLGTAVLDVATGTGTITATMSQSGTRNIQAIYSGDSNFFHNQAGSVSIRVQ